MFTTIWSLENCKLKTSIGYYDISIKAAKMKKITISNVGMDVEQ